MTKSEIEKRLAEINQEIKNSAETCQQLQKAAEIINIHINRLAKEEKELKKLL